MIIREAIVREADIYCINYPGNDLRSRPLPQTKEEAVELEC